MKNYWLDRKANIPFSAADAVQFDAEGNAGSVFINRLKELFAEKMKADAQRGVHILTTSGHRFVMED